MNFKTFWKSMNRAGLLQDISVEISHIMLEQQHVSSQQEWGKLEREKRSRERQREMLINWES